MKEIKNRPLCEGQKRIDKYIFSMKNLLGRGSYASVYKGTSAEDESVCAVKVIDQKLFANTYNFKTIQSEIQIMKKIQHKNIVELYDVYQSANNIYLVTEYCEEGDLKDYLRRRDKLSQPEALKILKDLMSGFKYLYEKEIIHRDLKPANILMHKGRCKISDFGFARNLEYGESTVLKSIVGTPLYMSPQILNHEKYTNKSDLWSVGLIYYELLHGNTPWPAKNQLQLINNIMTKKICFDPNISDKSKDFILACLKVKQDDRITWEQSFVHPLFTDEPLDKLKRNTRFDTSTYSNKQNSAYRHSRSKSTQRITNQINRTLRIRKQTSGMQHTPERISNWRA